MWPAVNQPGSPAAYFFPAARSAQVLPGYGVGVAGSVTGSDTLMVVNPSPAGSARPAREAA